jgi:hypothetical protein
MFTNTGLVEHAKKALNERWGYVWGTFGQVLTPALYQYKLGQYPDSVGKYADFIESHWLNGRTTDCVGLIKSYIWWNGLTAVYPKNRETDVSANGMLNVAKEKGPISTLPEIPGVCLWKEGHIGVYIGNGQVIEARGTKVGVIQSPLTGVGSAGWTDWLKCPFITYEGVDWKTILQKASANPDEWITSIEAVKNAAEAEGNLGVFEIFKHLPALIEKIYSSK